MELTILERPTLSKAKDFKVSLQKELEKLKGELTASISVNGFTQSGWTRISVIGQDSEIVSELIADKFSLACTESRLLESAGVYQAAITGSNDRGLTFDLGLDREHLNCIIPANALLAQLADGKTIQLRQLIECYCLYPGLKISVRLTQRTNREIEGWLSDKYMDHIENWVTTGLDRILIFDCYKKEAESAVLTAHLSRDVIAVESETFTLQSIVCKLGTDGVGLIPKIGYSLRKQKLRPFLPKRIIDRCRHW